MRLLTSACLSQVRGISLLLLVLIPVYVEAQENASKLSKTRTHLQDVFSPGWFLKDTNADGIVDFLDGKIIVPVHPTAGENTAAANFAARLGFGTTGLTPPLVINSGPDPAGAGSTSTDSASSGASSGARIWIGKDAVPAKLASIASSLLRRLRLDEGGVFVVGEGLAVLGQNEAGLTAAANAFSARAPYVWKVPGDQFDAVLDEVSHAAAVEPVGFIYKKGQAGVFRILLQSTSKIPVASLRAALKSPHLAQVHELVVLGKTADVSAVSATAQAAFASGSSTNVAGSVATTAGAAASGAATDTEGATPQPLDLATVYTQHGLFKGSAKMPIPSSLDGQLLVPEGAAGTALANLAARMGLETTGLSLPLAKAATEVVAKDVHTKAVLPEASSSGKALMQKLTVEDSAFSASELPLSPGHGELRVVDRAFDKQSAVVVRGDEQGSAAAVEALANHMPNLWETGKQYDSLEEMRFDLHRFFSLRSSSGQASVALYHLSEWIEEIKRSGRRIQDVQAEVYVDVADQQLERFVQQAIESGLGSQAASVKVASLHAGTQCCAENPALHYEQPGFAFHQGTPTFSEDITIPWEGTTLLNLIRDAAHSLSKGEPARLVARISEGPEVRRNLKKQLTDLLVKSGVPANKADVQVLCAYKQGYSWLLDEMVPKLQGKSVARIQIDFAKNVDSTGLRLMYTPARWVQELYPVDEMIAKALGVRLQDISLNQMDNQVEGQADGPTYRLHAFDASGAEVLKEDFSVATTMQPYNGVIQPYERVEVETGWVKMQSGAHVLIDRRIETDIESFWDHYQNQTLPRVYRTLMTQAQGEIRPEYAPAFDTLRMDFHLSEPDYATGLDKERISTLEALQEDTFYSTENFINMLTGLESGRPEVHVGRIIPIVHGSEDGHDGHVRVEFFAKPAANPMVRLRWTDGNGQKQERERNLPVLSGPMQPRLIRAHVIAGTSGFEDLTWVLPADYEEDQFDEWIKLQPQEQVERSIFPAYQAKGQLQWLGKMHEAGLYKDELAYPHLKRLGFEFELPVSLTKEATSPAPRSFVSFPVEPPTTSRPMIARYASQAQSTVAVQWEEPIPLSESAAYLARFAERPGVNAYWLGRSYLGRDMWAADFTLPSPALLRSSAKETTLKASILYSGRQHANEVSSTSHLDKLGELLLTDPQTRAMLRQVNVILHPIDNPDGAELSTQLAKITPDNLLHPGYHGSLAADVVTGQAESDPVYPETRTRRLLLESWLPDGFLNPHGYPSHEWVQPFSEYTGWVQSREGANPGRAWWIPRGWFTSLTYLRDPDHLYSQKLAFEIRDRIVAAERSVPGLLPLEERMNARYERFGQRWQPKDMTQPIVNGIRIYMSLKGTPAPRGGAEAARTASATGGVSPDITWDSGYTEAPDETAHGDYLKLMASAGLAFDRVHLQYLSEGKLRIRRTQREVGDKVVWQVVRDRPNLPETEKSSASDKQSEK